MYTYCQPPILGPFENKKYICFEIAMKRISLNNQKITV
jgi:hypothetical protein